MKLIKLDGRHTARDRFMYAFEFTSSETILFNQQRVWLWETFGSSSEVDGQAKLKDLSNKHWAWEWQEWKIRLYLHSDSELAMFKLKWL